MFQRQATQILGDAALAGADVEVPIFLRSVSESVERGQGAIRFCFAAAMVEELDRKCAPDDPTRVVEHYQADWWNQLDEDRGYFSEPGDNFEDAYEFHVNMVSCGPIRCPNLSHSLSQFR